MNALGPSNRFVPSSVVCVVVAASGCAEFDPDTAGANVGEEGGVVEILAVHDADANEHRFELSEAEVPSGWTTLELVNASPHEHLAQIFRVPEGVTPEVWIDELIVPLQGMFDRFQVTGDLEGARAAVDYPAWWSETTPMGGPGLVAPGRTATVAVQLEPGRYIVECYVKDSEERFHTTLGMAALLVVTDESSGAPEPDADLVLTISGEGIRTFGDVSEGEKNVLVFFEERVTPGYRNVNLARLDRETDLDELSRWMNFWMPGRMTAPAPAEFVGGSMRKPAGHRTYVTVDLEAGDYAWVSEFADPHDPAPDLMGEGWLEPFTVDPDPDRVTLGR